MPRVSSFIVPAKEPYSFRDFQDLPPLIQQALAWATKQQDAGVACHEEEVSQYMIDRFDVNQTVPIGTLIDRMLRFVGDPVRCRMVRCYVDCRYHMLTAKLTWREDY